MQIPFNLRFFLVFKIFFYSVEYPAEVPFSAGDIGYKCYKYSGDNVGNIVLFYKEGGKINNKGDYKRINPEP